MKHTHTQCRSRYSLDTETADSTYTNCIIHRRERFAYTHTQQIGLQLIQFTIICITIICITICITICIMNCIWTISKLFKKNRVNIWTYLIMGGITHTTNSIIHQNRRRPFLSSSSPRKKKDALESLCIITIEKCRSTTRCKHCMVAASPKPANETIYYHFQ